MLIDNGAMRENQHFVDAQGQTPLHIAVAASQIQAVETLVRKCPAWISAKDLPPHSHYICLSYFVHSKHCQGNGTNGSVKKHQNKTMLEWFLFEKNNADLQDKRGRTPMDLARSERLKAILNSPRTEEALGIPSCSSSHSCPRLYSRS